MKLFHQIVTTINQLLFLVISQPSPVWDLLHTWLLPAPGPGWERTTRTGPSAERPPSARIKSLLYEILPAANNSGCEHCISQSGWPGPRSDGGRKGPVRDQSHSELRPDTPLIDLTRHNLYWRRITRVDCMETFHEIRLLNIIPGTFIKNNLWLWNISTLAEYQATNKHSWVQSFFCVFPIHSFCTLYFIILGCLAKTSILVFPH